MPLVRISVIRGKPAAHRRNVAAAFHRAEHLAELGVRRENVWINLVEVARENWAIGNGVASYAP